MATSTLLSVRVVPEIAARLEQLAEATERSKSYLAAEAIEEYLSLHEWQIQAIQKSLAEADRGEVVNFEDVKKYWEERLEDSTS